MKNWIHERIYFNFVHIFCVNWIFFFWFCCPCCSSFSTLILSYNFCDSDYSNTHTIFNNNNNKAMHENSFILFGYSYTLVYCNCKWPKKKTNTKNKFFSITYRVVCIKWCPFYSSAFFSLLQMRSCFIKLTGVTCKWKKKRKQKTRIFY